MKNETISNNFNISFNSRISNQGTKFLLETELSDDISSYSEEITRKVVETEDRLVKESLKSLGWISPEDADKVKAYIKDLAYTQSFERGYVLQCR